MDLNNRDDDAENSSAINKTTKNLSFADEQVLRFATVGMQFATIATDLFMPIDSTIISIKALESLIAELDMNDESKSNFLDLTKTIKSNAIQVSSSLKSLMDEASEVSLNSRQRLVYLDTTVAKIMSDIEHLSGTKSVAFRYSFDAPKAQVYIDVNQLQQVIVNLIDNAVDSIRLYENASHRFLLDLSESTLCNESEFEGKSVSLTEPFHGITIWTKIVTYNRGRRANARPQSFWRLYVEDSGVGISPEVFDRIFMPFVTTKNSIEGNGLGLSISQGIISNVNGTISACNRRTNGACFIVSIPIPLEISE